MERIDHSEAYSLDGVQTNLAESARHLSLRIDWLQCDFARKAFTEKIDKLNQPQVACEIYIVVPNF
jgi:hypothetical protein